MTGKYTESHHKTMFECICIDKDPESIQAAVLIDTNGALFYHVKGRCSTELPCPPYTTLW